MPKIMFGYQPTQCWTVCNRPCQMWLLALSLHGVSISTVVSARVPHLGLLLLLWAGTIHPCLLAWVTLPWSSSRTMGPHLAWPLLIGISRLVGAPVWPCTLPLLALTLALGKGWWCSLLGARGLARLTAKLVWCCRGLGGHTKLVLWGA